MIKDKAIVSDMFCVCLHIRAIFYPYRNTKAELIAMIIWFSSVSLIFISISICVCLDWISLEFISSGVQDILGC